MGFPRLFLFSGAVLPGQNHYHYQGRGAWRLGDMQARALIPFLRKNIPGEPNIVIENMPGAAGMKAVNHIYSSAKPDGLAIASAGTPIITGPTPRDDRGKVRSRQTHLSRLYRERRSLCFSYPARGRARQLGETARGLGSESARRRWATRSTIAAASSPFCWDSKIRGSLSALAARRSISRLRAAKSTARDKQRGHGGARNRESLDKGAFNIHATITIPRGSSIRVLPKCRSWTVSPNDEGATIDSTVSFVSVLALALCFTASHAAGDRQDACGCHAKAFSHPEFPKEFHKLMGADPSPLTGEEMDSALKELPRDPAALALYKKMSEHGPLPAR